MISPHTKAELHSQHKPKAPQREVLHKLKTTVFKNYTYILMFKSIIIQIKKNWYIYTMGYDSAIKKRMKLPFATTWMDQHYHTKSEKHII